jgi:hypothetical protein
MGYKLEGLFLRSSSPRALASFAAILGQELWESQAKNSGRSGIKHRAHRERRGYGFQGGKSLGNGKKKKRIRNKTQSAQRARRLLFSRR